MRHVSFELSESKYKFWLYYLRKHYNAPKVGLKRLIKGLVQETINREASREAEQADQVFEELKKRMNLDNNLHNC
jgi:hypothetical protein